MTIHHIGQAASILNTFVSETRDREVQKDAMRFRRNIERIGEILSYELSKTLSYASKKVSTPLGTKDISLPNEEVVVCSILRAGLPLHQGVLNYFDKAENTFISAYRRHTGDGDDFEIVVEYLASPSIEGKVLILADPMLATGQSLVAVKRALASMGTPKKTHLVSVIGAQTGIDFVNEHFEEDAELWIAAIDETLNDKGYIIPGLGDAGDLAFGSKMQH